MIKFPAIAAIVLLGLIVIAVWIWARWRRRDKKSATHPLPPTVSPDTVEETAVEQPGKVEVLVTQTQTALQTNPVTLPEVVCDFAPPMPSESQPIVLDSDDAVSQHPSETSAASEPPDATTVVDPFVSHAEQPTAPVIVVPAELNVKEKTETATFHTEDGPKTSTPFAVPPEIDSTSHERSVQPDVVTITPSESAVPSTVKEAEPSAETLQQETPEEPDIAPRPPTYHPTAPAATNASPRTRRPANTRPTQNTNVDLQLRVQLVFGKGGDVRNVALAPARRDGMPSDIEVSGTQGALNLTELCDDCYEPVTLVDAGNALLQGIEWRGNGAARRWRWVLGGRELYILAPGEDFGLRGFVSTARLWLNARHVVLVTAQLREEVMAALAEAGCGTPEVSDGTTSGVPSGWLLFRDVTPTRAVRMRDDRDILNSLCPAHEIEPHFVGGIRLERNIWLAAYPPRIRFTGEIANGFEVKIDGQTAHPADDGAFEAPGWDSEGEHRLWFSDRAETYSLRTMMEGWDTWTAHDFCTGAAICGASTHRIDGARWRQVRVPTANPLLVGAQPGEIFCCETRHDVRSETILAMVPFAPVWALPIDPVHADKRSARLVPLDLLEPTLAVERSNGNRRVSRELRRWVTVVNDAGRKQLALSAECDEAKTLWRRYRVVAKQLWKKIR